MSDNSGIYLFETKTKGDIDERALQRQLTFDLQTMFYIVALQHWSRECSDPEHIRLWNQPINGVRYNVVRRPLSGGKGTIVRHKPSKSNPAGESAAEFYARLGGIVREDPGHYFMRWRVEITPEDVERFEREFLRPQLEALCDWWDWISDNPNDPWGQDEQGRAGGGVHARLAFGVYNPVTDGSGSDLDEYIASGSEVGLQRAETLFGELQ